MMRQMTILCISILSSLNGLNGLTISHHLTKGREPLQICTRDCFDSGMHLLFPAKAIKFKTKGQEDN
eukprot:scaffold2422_cov56-Attheya_sp.AAC.15